MSGEDMGSACRLVPPRRPARPRPPVPGRGPHAPEASARRPSDSSRFLFPYRDLKGSGRGRPAGGGLGDVSLKTRVSWNVEEGTVAGGGRAWRSGGRKEGRGRGASGVVSVRRAPEPRGRGGPVPAAGQEGGASSPFVREGCACGRCGRSPSPGLGVCRDGTGRGPVGGVSPRNLGTFRADTKSKLLCLLGEMAPGHNPLPPQPPPHPPATSIFGH